MSKNLMRHYAQDLVPFIPELEDLPLEKIKEQLNLERVAKLSFNEAPQGPSPTSIKAMQEAALNLNLYPDPSATKLRTKLSDFYHLPVENFIVSNGADEMIVLLTQAFLNADEEVIIPSPTFGQYFVSTQMLGAVPVKVGLTEFTIDLDKVSKAITKKTKMVILCNPNNPTGTFIPKEQLKTFIENLPDHVLLVLDEAYGEYVENSQYMSTISLVDEYPNIVTIRTFSKIYGLAAARVGYAVACPAIIEGINKVRPPFNLNAFAQAGALAALEDQKYIAELKKYNLKAKKELYSYLDQAKISYIPSETNFVFIDTGRDCKKVFQHLAQRGVLVRTAEGWGLPTFIRLTIGCPEDMQMFYNGFNELLKTDTAGF